MSEQSLAYAVFVKTGLHGDKWVRFSAWTDTYSEVLEEHKNISLQDMFMAKKIVIRTMELDDYLVEESRGNENGN